MTTNRLPLIIPAGAGQDFGGLLCKVRAEQTAGAYSILELTLAPGQGAPLHIHQREDEIFYVIEGQCDIQYSDVLTTATIGSVAVLPKGVPHAFRNSGTIDTRILITAVPGGLEGFFEESNRVASDDPDAPAKRAAIARRYQIDFSPTG
jgi:mannose-6-phosphate isomerase-like protein (cupin superfamily)